MVRISTVPCENKRGSLKHKVIFFHRYSMNAILDVPLSKQLDAGRLFVGQKLRVMCWSEFCFHISCADLGSRIMWLERASFTL